MYCVLCVVSFVFCVLRAACCVLCAWRVCSAGGATLDGVVPEPASPVVEPAVLSALSNLKNHRDRRQRLGALRVVVPTQPVSTRADSLCARAVATLSAESKGYYYKNQRLPNAAAATLRVDASMKEVFCRGTTGTGCPGSQSGDPEVGDGRDRCGDGVGDHHDGTANVNNSPASFKLRGPGKLCRGQQPLFVQEARVALDRQRHWPHASDGGTRYRIAPRFHGTCGNWWRGDFWFQIGDLGQWEK